MVDGSITSRPYAGLPQNTDDDRERARELYRYFRPPVAAEPIDTVLTAHAQLAAWRLNAERAMISLIDEETQYFVAESTKTVHLDDAEQYEDPDDAIWAGCVRVPKAGRLCEHTIAAPPPPDGGPACFEVLDLSKDERFNHLGFIAGPPHFRYYAGVPLRTGRGINIGSIYILDSKTRPALTRKERHFLGVMADNVIQHLEMSRDKKDRQRNFRMNACLSAYVDPTSEYVDRRKRRSSNHSQSTDPDSDADSRRTGDGYERIEVVDRAAELLREAMDLEEGGGGVLYLDTSLAAVPLQHPSSGDNHPSGMATRGLAHESPQFTHQRAESGSALTIEASSRSPSPSTSTKRTHSTEVVAHTYKSMAISSDQPEFLPFTPGELLQIVKRYPRGRLFTYDQQGQELSDSSDNDSTYHGRPRSRRRRQRSAADSAILHAHFPKARQIMFVPIWDSTTSRSAACFVYNCSEYRNFSHQLEFLTCITFNNCVDKELLRLANLKATEQKNNFIGSISHELRSPLHGILASCEFLQDTTCDSFQKSLIRTAESCARTLLDTVNMVLDYSKINAFEKDKPGSTFPGLADDIQSKNSEVFQTSLNTHRLMDLSVLTEEVVEGVATGHTFKGPKNQALDHDSKSNGTILSDSIVVAPRRPNVELIVELSEQDWMYWCEPGSLRRIVMNLVGNSLKYTQSGFVHVKLDTQIAEQDATEYGILTVTDSGQGISPAYLKDKLYTPFAQESNQAPGIGLGLSLVKSIIDSIGGHIDIDSEIGAGTKVTVRFPLVRKSPLDPKLDSLVEATSFEKSAIVSDEESSIQKTEVQQSASVALYWVEEEEDATNDQKQASHLLRETLTAYLSAWSRKPVLKWREDCTADIVVVEESAFDTLLRRCPTLSNPTCRTMVLVLHSTSSAITGSRSNTEDIRHPVGPHKLARALQACWDRSRATLEGNVTEDAASVEHLTAATVNLDISFSSMSNPTAPPKHIQLVKKQLDSTDVIPASTESPSLLNISETPAKSTNKAPLPGRRILLVDDNTINLRLLQVGMKKRGYTAISSASDGLQAVNTYRTLLESSPPAPPDIILMDLSMPVMNGFEATRRIRDIEAEHNSTLPLSGMPHHSLIIALTGLASVRDQKEAYTAGVDSYIMKPVRFAKLTELLEDWTAGGKAGVSETMSNNVSVVA